MSPEQVVALLAVIADLQLAVNAVSAERDGLAEQVRDLAARLAEQPPTP